MQSLLILPSPLPLQVRQSKLPPETLQRARELSLKSTTWHQLTEQVWIDWVQIGPGVDRSGRCGLSAFPVPQPDLPLPPCDWLIL